MAKYIDMEASVNVTLDAALSNKKLMNDSANKTVPEKEVPKKPEKERAKEDVSDG